MSTPTITLKCAVCGSEFVALRPTKTTCSVKCKSKAQRAREKDRVADAVLFEGQLLDKEKVDSILRGREQARLSNVRVRSEGRVCLCAFRGSRHAIRQGSRCVTCGHYMRQPSLWRMMLGRREQARYA